jgi:predicted nucleic acid-binding protein
MGKTQIVPFDERLALRAAEASLEHGIPMADAIVYATALAYEATIITSDADFKRLPGVVYLPKK